MRIQSDLAGALDDEDSEPSAASEMEMLRPHLHDQLGSLEADAPPRPSNPTNWVIYVAAAGLVVSLMAAAVLLFGGALLSALAFWFA
jgi:hypothetical protein